MLIISDYRLPIPVKKRLMECENQVIQLPPHPTLPAPVASHPDMLLFFTSDTLYCAKSYRQIAKQELDLISSALSLEIKCIEAELGNRYPLDVPLNAAPIGWKLLCHPKHTAAELRAQKDYTVIPVRQGYAKCSILPVGDSALITEDPSIARAARKNHIEVLQVRQNCVRLKGYATGFLGGAASFAPFGDSREILFCGSLDTHPDAARIREFCLSHGYHTVSLSDEPLYDVGTMFVFDLNNQARR